MYVLQRLIMNKETQQKEWTTLRMTMGAPYLYNTEQEALDTIKYWDDGTAVYGEFRAIPSIDAEI